jgi:ribosomal protein L39E
MTSLAKPLQNRAVPLWIALQYQPEADEAVE